MPKNILQEIQDLIQSLKSDPKSIDIDGLINTLSSAYQVASDGLQRSQAAQLLPGKLKEIETLKADNQSLRSELAEIKPRITELDLFNPLLDRLKAELNGKLSLLPNYSDEFKAATAEEITGASVEKYIELAKRFEEEFRIAFTGQPEGVINAKTDSETVIRQPELYSSGG